MTATKKPTPEKTFRTLLKARTSVIWVTTGEERRAERAIAAAAVHEAYDVRFWDCATGCKGLEGEKIDCSTDIPAQNPHAVFEGIRKREKRILWIMRDLPDLLAGDVVATRALKSIARDLQEEMDASKFQTVVILCPTEDVPLTLRGSVTVMDWPLPSREEISTIIDQVIAAAPPQVERVNGNRESIIDAAAGLAADDIANAFALSIVRQKRIDPVAVSTAKKAIIDRTRLLGWIDPDPRGLAGIGGLDLLKVWFDERRAAFSPEARAYGLHPVRGVLLIGPSGTGKSLAAKCVAAALGLPLLRLDLGAMKGSLMGQSEGNIRAALKTAEAIMRCVLWSDELEKSIAGTRGPSGDSGVAADQLGTLLTWRQECDLPIFWVATCNDPMALPPELISRFDETFFVDLPTTREREEIFAVELRRVNRNPDRFDLGAIAKITPGFSGREIWKLVGAAMFTAFSAKRELHTEDLLAARWKTVPVSESAKAAVEAQRAWANGRARPASNPEVSAPASPTAAGLGRAIELE